MLDFDHLQTVMKTFILLTWVTYYCGVKQTLGHLARQTVSSREEPEEFPWNSIRLPQSVIPVEYNILLHPNLTEFWFLGLMEIKCEVRETTNFVVLHSKDLIITQTTLTTLPSNEKNDVRIRMKTDADQLFLLMEDIILKDTEILITIAFNGVLNVLGKGFYLSEYSDSNFGSRYLASTQFEPIDARMAFPCFDEPALKAKFSMSIVREKKHISLFNMPREDSLPYGENLMVDKFQQSVKMSTYLVAFAVCEFEGKFMLTKSGVNMTVYYAPTSQRETVDYSLNAGVTILDYFNTLFEVPYPQPNLDMIAVPYLKAAAMENWGLVTYQRPLLVIPKNSGPLKKFMSASVIAHEIAHQWFGNIVTMEWWDDIWLNEGITSFMQYLGLQAVNSNWSMEKRFTEKLVSMKFEEFTNSRVLDQPVAVPDFELMDTVTYSKGASIIRMVRGLLGEDAFMTGIKNYLNLHKYSNVVSDDLWEALSNSTENNIDMKAVMNTWMVERAYPLVTVHRNHSKVRISQAPFILENTTANPTTPRWSIPFQYGILDRNGHFSKQMLILSEETAIINVRDDVKLVKGNYGDDGYYRVNYDNQSWKAITDQLIRNHKIFSPGDRAHLLDDAVTFTRTHLLNTSVIMDLINYMEKETDYLPWFSATAAFRSIKFKPGDNEIKVLMEKVVRVANRALELIENQADKNDMDEVEVKKNVLVNLIRNIDAMVKYSSQTTLGSTTDQSTQGMD